MSFIGRRVDLGTEAWARLLYLRASTSRGSRLYRRQASMRVFHPTIATLVMMAFVSAYVLAGTPLMLRVGEDGHRPIELGLDAEYHAEAQDDHVCANPNEHHAAPPSGFSDSPLLSDAQSAHPLAQPGCPFALGELLALAFATKPDVPECAFTAHRALPAGRAASPILRDRALQTVKLLI